MTLLTAFLALSFAQQTGLGADAVTHWHLGDEGVPVPLAIEQSVNRLIHDDIMATVVRSVLVQQEADKSAKQLVGNQTGSGSGSHQREDKEAEWQRSARAGQDESYGVCSPTEKQSTGPQERCLAKVSDDDCFQDRFSHTSGGKSTDHVMKEVISPLSCHIPAVETEYDKLQGIKRRKKHPMYPEPDVAIIFKSSARSASDVNMNEVEQELLSTVSSKSLSEIDYNRLGNFWRVRGDTHEAIDCYRQGLSQSPDHPDLLLNLARVLVNLEYWEDAKELVHRSLQVKSPEHSSWLEQYTLGEISKETGSVEDAIIYFRQALDLNPNFELAQCQLQELEVQSTQIMDSFSTILYTVVILLLLTAGVLFLLLWLLGDEEEEDHNDTMNWQQQMRHRDRHSRTPIARNGKSKHKSKG